MSLLLRSRSFAAASLVLVGAGLVAIACGSDKASSPGTTGNGTDTSSTGNPPSTPDNGGSATPGNNTPGNETPAGGTPNPAPSGNEGQMGNIPVQTPNMPGTMMGGTPPAMTPPTTPVPVTVDCSAPVGAAPNLTLQPIGNFVTPIFVTGVPGDDTRLVVVEKGGAVRVLVNGQVQDAPFIDVSAMRTGNGLSEQGLLGLAFHPDFQSNGLFYLHFSSSGAQGLPPQGDTVVAEFTANAERTAADPATRRVVLTIDQPQANHNGGMITFGADRMLYLGFGDGGGGDDQHGATGNAQNLSSLLGKILRIDPLGRGVNGAYSNPAQNLAEATGQQAAGEVWAAGLRHPWRFSFDPCNGDLYIGDVGQNAEEEVDFVAAAADTRLVPAGKNFGWRVAEGTICRPMGTEPCNAQVQGTFVGPVDSYAAGNRAQPAQQAGSVTGGYVYRGSSIPGLRGTYIYADYVRSSFFRFRIENGAIAGKTDITTQMRPTGGNLTGQPVSFGMDNKGELYVVTATANGGAVYRVAAAQ